jgi:hypothetical protein
MRRICTSIQLVLLYSHMLLHKCTEVIASQVERSASVECILNIYMLASQNPSLPPSLQVF